MDHVRPLMADALILKYGEIKPAVVPVLLEISSAFLEIFTAKQLADAKNA